MQEYVLGIDVGGTNIKAGAVDYRGKILAHETSPTEASLGADAIFDKIHKLAATLQHEVQDARVRAAGIGIPGAILSNEGVVTQAPNIPSWDGMPIRKILQD
ncbi:MAG TPA: ROK family protein, partial [Acidobacteriota bacterium]|nr:ROK family protein [Acidobacteriota bacterium]